MHVAFGSGDRHPFSMTEIIDEKPLLRGNHYHFVVLFWGYCYLAKGKKFERMSFRSPFLNWE